MRKTAHRSALAALALAAALAGCAMPPYNEELSLAQLTRAKLGEPVVKIGPVFYQLDESASRNRYYFLPDRDDPAAGGGFVVGESSYGLRIWFVAPYSSNTNLGSDYPITVDNGSATSNNYLLQPIKDGSPADTNHFMILTRYQRNDLWLIHATGPSTVTRYTTELPLLSYLPSAGNVLGSNIFADAASSSDLHFFLAGQGSSYYYEYGAQTDTSDGFALISSGLMTDLGPVPDGLSSAFYVHDPIQDRSYLSYPSGSSYISYAWNWNHEETAIAASGFQQLTGVKGRIEAVLRNGQLLAFEDNTCTVYDPAGKKLNDFPLGGLKFCYERTDGTTGTVYFSLAYWLWGRDEKSDQLYVEAYAIPTDSLATLR